MISGIFSYYPIKIKKITLYTIIHSLYGKGFLKIETQLSLDKTLTGSFCPKCDVHVNMFIQECIYIKRGSSTWGHLWNTATFLTHSPQNHEL